MADRITNKLLENTIKGLARLTELSYRYDQNMSWHNLSVIGPNGAYHHVLTTHNKRDMYNALVALQSFYYALQNMGKIPS